MLVYHIQWVSDNNPFKMIKSNDNFHKGSYNSFSIIIHKKILLHSGGVAAVNGHLTGTLNSCLKFVSFSH